MTSFLSDINSTDNALQKENVESPMASWREMTLGIKAEPSNIKLHTQRIMLSMNPQLQPYVSGALQDFFITLKATGRPLREKMFILVSPLMENANRQYFKQWLDEDSDTNLECAHHPGAVLSSDTCQTSSETVDEEDETMLLDKFLSESFNNPVDKARYCVAYGFVDHGQKLLELEMSLEGKSNRAKIEEELLTIYYYSKNKRALLTMLESLLANKRQLSEDWKKVQNIAEEW